MALIAVAAVGSGYWQRLLILALKLPTFAALVVTFLTAATAVITAITLTAGLVIFLSPVFFPFFPFGGVGSAKE